MTVFRAPPHYPRWPAVAALIHRSFAYMTPLLGHPAQAMKLTPEDLEAAAGRDAAWLVEQAETPIACLFTRPSRDFGDALYLGWLSVESAHRGSGLVRALMNAAEQEARRQGCSHLTLDTGRELVELHRLFQHLGFRKQATDGAVICFRKPVAGEGPPLSTGGNAGGNPR